MSDVGVSGFTFRGFKQHEAGTFAIDAEGVRDAAIVGNRFIGNGSRARSSLAGASTAPSRRTTS